MTDYAIATKLAATGGHMVTAHDIVAAARHYAGVTEVPPGSNRGPHIDGWLEAVGAAPPASWCAAFAVGVLREAGAVPTPSASALHFAVWNPAAAEAAVGAPLPGDVIVWDHGHGLGHVAICTGAGTCIAGNTSPDGRSREGTGVYEHAYDATDARIVCHLRFWETT